MDSFQEELHVLYEATRIGRADIVKEIIRSLRAKMVQDAAAASSASSSNEGETIDDDNDLMAILSCPRQSDGLSPLHIAVLNNQTDVVRTLLQAGVSLSYAPPSGTKYADKRPYDIASEVVKKAFDIYLMDQIAVGNAAQVGRLLDGGVSLKTTYSGNNDSMLHWAATFADVVIIRELIAHECDLGLVNSDGKTCLHVLIQTPSNYMHPNTVEGFLSIIRELLLNGMDWKAVDKYGKIAFDYCSETAPFVDQLQTLLNDIGVIYTLPVQVKKAEVSLPTNASAPVVDKSSAQQTSGSENGGGGVNGDVKVAALATSTSDDEEDIDNTDNFNLLAKYYNSNKPACMLSSKSMPFYIDDVKAAEENAASDDVAIDEQASSSAQINIAANPLSYPMLWPPPSVYNASDGFLVFRKGQAVEFRLQLVNTRLGEPKLSAGSSSGSGLTWTMDKDYELMLKCSGIVDFFETFNISPVLDCVRTAATAAAVASVSSSSSSATTTSSSAAAMRESKTVIRLAVDPRVCCGTNRFTIEVKGSASGTGYGSITLIASDFQGLSYAVKDLCQLFTFCTLNLSTDSSDPSVAFQCPSMTIDSQPAIAQRAALVNLGRSNIEENVSTFSVLSMRKKLSFLANLHFNMVFAIIENSSSLSPSSSTSASSSTEDNIIYRERVQELHEYSAQVGLDMVPLVKIDRLGGGVRDLFSGPNGEILMSFSATSIAVMLTLDDLDLGAEEELSTAAVQDFLLGVFLEIAKLDYTAVFIFSGGYLSSNFDLCGIANALGLTSKLYPLHELLSPSLFSRPIMTASVMMKRVCESVGRIAVNGNSLAVFPYVFDKDFMYPSIFLKYFAFLFAGMTWNSRKAREIFKIIQSNESAEYVGLSSLKQLVHYFIVGDTAMSPENGNAISAITSLILTPYQFLNIRAFVGNFPPSSSINNNSGSNNKIVASSSSSSSIGGSSSNQTLSNSEGSENFVQQFFGIPNSDSTISSKPSYACIVTNNFSLVEEYLYGLMSRENAKIQPFPFVENKHIFVYLSKLYKKFLQHLNWKISITTSTTVDFLSFLKGKHETTFESKFCMSLEFEEVAVTIYIYNVLLKAIISALAAHDKAPSQLAPPQSFVQLLGCIPPGIKSDIANSLLEAMKHMCIIWKKKYQKVSLNQEYLSALRVKSNNSSAASSRVIDSSNSEALMRLEESLSSSNSTAHTATARRLSLFHVTAKTQSLSGRAESKLPLISIFQHLIEKLDLPASILQPFVEMFL